MRMNQNQLPIRLQNRPNSPSGVLPHQRILHYHNLVTMLFHHGVLTTATVADDSVRGKYGFLGHSDNHIRGSQRGTAGSPRELCPSRLDNALLSRIGRNPEDVRVAGPAHRSSLELCWRRRLRMASEYFEIARKRSVRAERSCALLLQIEGAPHGWGKGGVSGDSCAWRPAKKITGTFRSAAMLARPVNSPKKSSCTLPPLDSTQLTKQSQTIQLNSVSGIACWFRCLGSLADALQ